MYKLVCTWATFQVFLIYLKCHPFELYMCSEMSTTFWQYSGITILTLSTINTVALFKVVFHQPMMYLKDIFKQLKIPTHLNVWLLCVIFYITLKLVFIRIYTHFYVTYPDKITLKCYVQEILEASEHHIRWPKIYFWHKIVQVLYVSYTIVTIQYSMWFDCCSISLVIPVWSPCSY